MSHAIQDVETADFMQPDGSWGSVESARQFIDIRTAMAVAQEKAKDRKFYIVAVPEA